MLLRFLPGWLLVMTAAVEHARTGSWGWDTLVVFTLYDVYLGATS